MSALICTDSTASPWDDVPATLRRTCRLTEEAARILGRLTTATD